MHSMTGNILGVIGGMGPLATQLFYQMIIEKTPAQSDQEHINMIILNHADMPDRTAYIKAGKKDILFEKLLKDGEFLQDSGAKALAIPCNTTHVLMEELKGKLDIPFVNMIEETGLKVKESLSNGQKVGIMATDGTVEMEIYQREIEKRGLVPILPSAKHQEMVMEMIYDGIKRGRSVTPEEFAVVSDELLAAGCKKVILGCTELSVIKRQLGLDYQFVDAMEVLAEKSVRACI